ncbi:WASH complex subunit 2 [Copidosoma floridanum]|uniref:WASH complex subunit 2 n=1 Tax=Copidosoma floridanum TaxID=29053 RepID=UPI0006C9E3F8|nr:WASH complex subunit 2 [Copidosoma floridanum]
MESTTGSSGIDKSWDHAWSTDEMRKNRRDWSLAADSGLLNHLQEFSENLVKRANETYGTINSLTDQLNQTSLLVDNITNTSMALSNSQFIESRVQEDNTEIEQPPEDDKTKEIEEELNDADMLERVCESIREGLKIMNEKFERVEVIASDSEDDDDNTLPSVIYRPKDPYKDRPLPYVMGSEKWNASTKVGLETSSSESEQEDEEDSSSDADNKKIPNVLSSHTRDNMGPGRMSSTSSESNDFNVESSSIKDVDKSRLYGRSQDTLNSDTEPTTPSSVLPKTQHISNVSSSFAEELAKRLGSVMPPERNVMARDANEPVIRNVEEDIFNPEEDQSSSKNKPEDLFSQGKNLFSNETSPPLWTNKPVRPVNKNIIPASIDVPPPLSNMSSAPKSTIDDLFGDADDSEDSDDIFSNKASKNIFASEREAVKSDVMNKQHLKVDSTSTITTSTPEMNDKGKGLFEDDDDDDDLFNTAAKEFKLPDNPSDLAKKKPVGGVSIFGKVDMWSSVKHRRSSSSSTSGSSDNDQQANSSTNPANVTISATGFSKNTTSGSTGNNNNNAFSSLEAGNNGTANSAALSNNSMNNGSSSGISVQQPYIDNTAGSSSGADFQPLMSSSRLKSEEIYREHLTSDSLFASKVKSSGNPVDQPRREQQQPLPEDVSEDSEDVFGPPPLPKDNPKSKQVASLFDDSDSGDDLFASASPSTRSRKSSEPTPSRAPPSTTSQPQPKKKNLFDDEIDLFDAKDAPDVDLFAAAPIQSLSKVAEGLFDDVPSLDDGDLFKPGETSPPRHPTKVVSPRTEQQKKQPRGLFDEDSDDSDLFGGASKSRASGGLFEEDSVLFGSSTRNVPEKKVVDKLPVVESAGKPTSLVAGKSAGAPEDRSKLVKPKKPAASIFDDSDDDEDLFAGSTKKIGGKKLLGEGEGVMDEEKVSGRDGAKEEKKSVFEEEEDDGDDEDEDDLFADKRKKKKKVSEGSPPVASPEAGAKTETAKPKNPLFAEMRQKLEKQHRGENGNGAEHESVVDGAASSRKKPPKSLTIQVGLPLPTSDKNSPSQGFKKPAVSAKIKNLMGNMEGLRMLSPTDDSTPFRKNNKEESNGNDDGQETPGGHASSEASSPSLASGASSPHTSGSRARDSPSLRSENTEGAISFDEPAQVETLTSIASKSRARIPAKRRPQSREARQSALLQSGIDFDVPDVITNSPTSDQPNGDANGDVRAGVVRPQLGKTVDDKSEISASRNTSTNLLSPSTDEEDLFDVPPDLPEDPAGKEDSLFGRAPILSPIERIERPRGKQMKHEDVTDHGKRGGVEKKRKEEKVEAAIDPLRDDSHDPLKDPSQLFAFVTKTPSPEKNEGLKLSEDDDSLFSNSSKSNKKAVETKTKSSLGLFDNDDDDMSRSDLFSSGKTKMEKKPLRDTKIDLFDEAALEDVDDESLFGSAKKKSEPAEVREEPPPLDEKPVPKSTKTTATDIFGDSSDEDDLFASSKKAIPKKTSTSLFDDEDDDDDNDSNNDIFGSSKSAFLQDSKAKINSTRPVVKKAVTRDLKKTAEKIVQDPLSLLQDD